MHDDLVSALPPVLALNSSTVAVAVVLIGAAVLAGYLAVRAGAGEQRRRRSASGASTDAAGPPSGPQRYLVTIRTHDGRSTQYPVVTAAGSKRAASIAFDNHTRTRTHTTDSTDGTSDSTESVRGVAVAHQGPADRAADGSVEFRGGDLFDRSEF